MWQTSLATRGTLGINLLTVTIGETRRKDGSTHRQSHGTKRKKMSLQIGVMDPTTATKVGDSRATPRERELKVSLCVVMMARLSQFTREDSRV